MKTKLVIVSLIISVYISYSQNTYVPDDNFEQALIDLGYDQAPLDDYVRTPSISGITELNLEYKNIVDITGIEDFVQLKDLNLDGNLIESIDISNMVFLSVFSIENNKLSSLDISKNFKLDYLNCGGNSISDIDVSNNVVLTYLKVHSNKLKSLNISMLPDLEYLTCSGNQLTTLDLSKNQALQYLYIFNNDFASIDISLNKELSIFWCFNNPLGSIDVKNNNKLKFLQCENTKLTSLDVSKNPLLEILNFRKNNLSEINLTNNTKLISLKCDSNTLISLDLSSAPNLEKLNCQTNNLQTLDLRSGNNQKIEIYFSNNNPELKCIYVDNPGYSKTNWTEVDASSTFVVDEITCEKLDCLPPVDQLNDASECEIYYLPEIVNGIFYTEEGGKGTKLNPGDPITQTSIVYIFSENKERFDCSNESKFRVTIHNTNDFELSDQNIRVEGLDIHVSQISSGLSLLYAVDNSAYQELPNFYNLSEGIHTLYVKDEFSCVEKSISFEIFVGFEIMPFFTPNNDGINDFWSVIDHDNTINKICIFDRFGKLLSEIAPNKQGWDGIYNSEYLPSTTYWYSIIFEDRSVSNGSFLLKR